MVDLTREMAGLLSALGPAPAHRGRVLQFAAANTGEGVSTVAREFARLAAVRARKRVWLIDADLSQQEQQDVVGTQADRFGKLGNAAAATPDGSIFYSVTPAPLARDGTRMAPSRLMTARPCLGGRLWVTRFKAESLRAGQRAEAVDDPRYWDAMRGHADTVVVDAPAADRADTAVILAPFVDATILVVAAGSTGADEAAGLRDEIEAMGGRIAGVVMNRSTYRTPALLKRLTG